METNKDGALRWDGDKIRYDLLEPYAIEQLGKVFTAGAKKYADHNWMKGMKWSRMMGSLERHYQAFKSGEDFDKETNLYHLAHVAWNALGIVSYYKLHPELDDRQHSYLKPKRIGLDIDDVLADWTGSWADYHGHDRPNAWMFDRNIYEKFLKMKEDIKIEDFYLNLPTLVKPEEIPFEPVCYVTSRTIPIEITEQWLDKNKFPAAKVYSLGFNASKVEALKDANVEVYVDDRYDNFVEINNAGICCYLFDKPHNRRYNVGYKRIYSLSELA